MIPTRSSLSIHSYTPFLLYASEINGWQPDIVLRGARVICDEPIRNRSIVECVLHAVAGVPDLVQVDPGVAVRLVDNYFCTR